MSQTTSQKYLGVFLDERLTFAEHFKVILIKINKSIGRLHNLQNLLPRNALITIRKSFIRPHIDYRDIIHDQTYLLLSLSLEM